MEIRKWIIYNKEKKNPKSWTAGKKKNNKKKNTYRLFRDDGIYENLFPSLDFRCTPFLKTNIWKYKHIIF